MSTRVTKLVRCRNKNIPQQYVDVEVLLAITLTGPDGVPVSYSLTPQNQGTTVTPCIIDDTDQGGNGKGNPHNCSRLSHMERMTAADDPTQILDVEILDAFVLVPPNNANPDGPDPANNEENLGGQIDSGQYNQAEHAFFCPNKKASLLVVDKTGLDQGQKPSLLDVTRSGHINMVTNAGDTDDHTEFSDSVDDVVPPVKHPYVSTIKMDAINFAGPDGNTYCMIVPKPGQDNSEQVVIDATKYVDRDPFTGEEHVPPDNTDANVYVSFPDKPKQSQGANLKKAPTSDQTGESGPINQGIFWWIKKISSPPRPWYWFATVQEPRAFSFFGNPPQGQSWGYRGFKFFDFFPVIWILSVNNPLISMGSFGSPSLELCAEEGNWDTTDDLPNVPGFNTLGGGGTFAPFGILPMTEPPVPTAQLPTSLPNIWQLTGLTQPPLADPTKPWNRQTNPYLNPTAAQAEACAKKFRDNWNATADGVNGLLEGFQSTSSPPDPRWPLAPPGGSPPGWAWSVPWYDPFIGNGSGMFGSGIQPGLPHHIPLEVFVPASVWKMDVGQLDPAIWDTTKAPPVRWSAE